MRAFGILLLCLFFLCCGTKPKKRVFIDPYASVKKHAADSAVKDFDRKKFTWRNKVGVPQSFYVEEILLKRYQLEVTVQQPLDFMCGTGLPDKYTIGQNCYDRSIDSLFEARFGKGTIHSVLDESTRVQEQYPDRYVHGDQPVFPGGDSTLFAALKKVIHYPPQARRDGVQGTVILRMEIDSSGKLTSVKVAKSVRRDLDSIAIAGVKTLPPFQPAFRRGRTESSTLLQPVKFVLQ